jgi:HEAT repeat protein
VSSALAEIGWRTLGQLGGVGEVDRAARRLGLVRVEGRAFRRAVWTGQRGSHALGLRACREGGAGFALRLDVAASLPHPGCLLVRSPRGLSRHGHAGLAAWVEDRTSEALQPGEAVGLAPEGARFSSARPASSRRLEAWIARLSALADEALQASRPELLLGLVRRAGRPSVRAEAARALFTSDFDPRAVGPALAAVQRDPAPDVRLTASFAAPTLDAALGPCVEVAGSEATALDTRARAVAQLVELACARDAPEAALEALGAFTLDREPAIRAAAARGAGRLGGPGLPLLEQTSGDDAIAVRDATARALGQVGGEAAETLLLGLLGEPPDLPLFRTVTAALGRIGGGASLDALAHITPRPGVSAALVDAALAAMRDIRARRPLARPGLLSLAAGGELGDPARSPGQRSTRRARPEGARDETPEGPEAPADAR